ncbi:MAG: ABC transporter ATP-binding protein [Alphaproteobacteria bacterium]|nr:ABC transporter ATP-binding protein [Alphaproteobacteria bacterium]
MEALVRRHWIWGLLVVGLVSPLLAPNDYVVGVLARICLYAMLALGLNIVVGFAGLLDIGYVAFFGIGSYVYAFVASPHFGIHLPFLPAMVIVTIAAAISGILIGAPTLRLRGDYLAIVTLGFGEITYICLVNLDRPVNITGGPSGLIRIDPPSFFGHAFGTNLEYYYLFLLTLGGLVYASLRLRDSRIGWAWRAIREDELAAGAMGINTTVSKLQAFALGATFAGFAGGLLASWQRSVFPDNFLFQESINVLAMVILGGMGSVLGVILGATIIVALPEIFRDLALYRLLAFGALMMVVMVIRPEGLWPEHARGKLGKPTAGDDGPPPKPSAGGASG